MPDPPLATGLTGLDRVIKGILPGDNIVWQVDAFEDYRELVLPFARAARDNGKKLIYFRFGQEACLLGPEDGAEVHELDPKHGFENFIAATHGVIQAAGEGAYYVFDVLSRMARDWYSDQMLANFFMLTCPYLYDLATVAYFGLYRHQHAARPLDLIRQTTQLFLDVYRHRGALYVHPIKVQHRHSPTMNMLHTRRGEDFRLVSSSAVISEIMTVARWQGVPRARGQQGPCAVENPRGGREGGRRYVLCLNEEEHRKDAQDRVAIVAHLRQRLKQGDQSLAGNKGYWCYLKPEALGQFTVDEERLAAEAGFDGPWLCRPNTEEAVAPLALQHKGLWQVEALLRTTQFILQTRSIRPKCDETRRGRVSCRFLAGLLKTSWSDGWQSRSKRENGRSWCADSISTRK